jgi:AraC family transcriptional regulator
MRYGRCCTRLSPADCVYAETLSRTAAGYLVRNYISGRPLSTNNARKLTPQQCKRAIGYIEECLGENLTLAGIAKAAGVSTGRLNSEFKRSMKLAPYQYVLNARVRRANVLLIPLICRWLRLLYNVGLATNNI